ncbi:dCTP deaminase [Azospirillum sp. TSA2s]|uniref:dCTP deaminase n=1 Tax=Azospirillum sp. TSA2s TaxID=709810 RepID=UPI00145B9CF9|nr:dCTP deaminase [Azospirillum sp. TSA2s]
MLLCDTEISLSGIIEPFEEGQVRKAGTSYGLSSYGYDVRLGREFVTIKPTGWALSPDTISEADVMRTEADTFVLHPGAFVLAVTAEYLRMPADVTGLVCDKSSWARCGLSVQNTVLEAGWHGEVTLELHNQSPRPLLLTAGQGIAQVLFVKGMPCATTYADRAGRYQGQRGVTLPRR